MWPVFFVWGAYRSPRAGVLCAAHVPRHGLTPVSPPLLRSAEHPNPRLSAVVLLPLTDMLRPRLQVQSGFQAAAVWPECFSFIGDLRTEENVVAARGSEVKEEPAPQGVGGGMSSDTNSPGDCLCLANAWRLWPRHERTRAGAAFSLRRQRQSLVRKSARTIGVVIQ